MFIELDSNPLLTLVPLFFIPTNGFLSLSDQSHHVGLWSHIPSDSDAAGLGQGLSSYRLNKAPT